MEFDKLWILNEVWKIFEEHLAFSLMFCEDVFPRMLMTMTSFKSSFCIHCSAREIRPNSIVDGILEDYTRYFIDHST